MKPSVCVMCSLQSVLCVAFSVSGSPLQRLVAALLVPVDRYCVHRYIYRHIYICIYGISHWYERKEISNGELPVFFAQC